jgi:hypothetical protein
MLYRFFLPVTRRFCELLLPAFFKASKRDLTSPGFQDAYALFKRALVAARGAFGL